MSQNHSGKPHWTAQFNLPDDTWEKLKVEALQQKISPLEVAVHQKFVDENKLLSFERQVSKIPTLKAEFFNSPAPEKLFEKFSYEESRINLCVPTTEWGGTVYWAKATSELTSLETPQTKGHWFLAPCSAILKWLDLWKSKVQPSATPAFPPQFQGALELPVPDVIQFAPPAPAPIPVPVPVPQPIPQMAPPPPVVVTQNPLPPVIELPGAPAELHPIEFAGAPIESLAPLEPLEPSVPEVTLVEPTIVQPIMAVPTNTIAPPPPPTDSSPSLDFSSLLEGVAPPSPAPAKAPELQRPKPAPTPGLESVKLDNLFADQPLELAHTQTAQTQTAQTQTPSFIKPVSTTPPVEEAFVPLELAEPAPAPEIQEPSLRGAEVKIEAPIPVASAPEASVRSASMSISFSQPGHVPKTIPTLPADKFAEAVEAAQNQDQLVDAFMGYWQNYFQQVMVLLLQQDHMVVWWHNQRFGADCKRGSTIPLDAPSVFQIVFKTAAPYHGYVTHSEINDGFFKIANAGKYPEHLSILPIASDGKVIAMALGTCTSSTAKTLTLHKLEEEAALFSKSLFKLASSSRKAS